jgi:hypothetical protein
LQDEYDEDIVDKIEKQIARRDFGFAYQGFIRRENATTFASNVFENP